MVAELGFVHFDLDVPSSCLAAKFTAALADLGRQWDIKIQVNTSQVRDHQCHPVELLFYRTKEGENDNSM